MADNREHGRGPLDSISSVAGAALAIGAGAALLYRSGGAQALSSGVKKLSHALNDTANTLSKTALQDMNAGFFSNLTRQFKQSFSEVDDLATLRVDTPKSMIDILLERHQRITNKSKLLYKRYDEEQMIYPLKLDFQQNYANSNSVLNRKVENIIDDFVHHTKSAVSYKDSAGLYEFNPKFIEKHFGDNSFSATQQDEMMRKLTDALRKKDSEADDFVKNNLPSIDPIISELGNIDSLAKQFGMRGRENNTQKFFNRVLGDQQATINDLLNNRDKFSNAEMLGIRKDLVTPANAMDALADLVRENPEYGNLFVDEAIRIDKTGNIYSFAEAAKLKDKFLDGFANTVAGKLLKARDVLDVKRAPLFQYFAPGKADPIMAAIAEGRNSTLLNDKYVRIINKTFRITDDNTLEHISALDDTYLMSGSHGTANRVMKYMSGDADRRPESKFKFLRSLDIGSNSAPSKIKGFTSFFGKFNDPRWGRNLMDSFLDADTNELQRRMSDLIDNPDNSDAKKYVGSYFDNIKKLDKFFSQTTRELDRGTINKLHDATSGESKEMMRMLTLTDGDLIDTLMRRNPNSFVNQDLQSLIRRYLTDANAALNSKTIISDNKGALGTTRAVSFTEMIRKEVAKEAFLTYRRASGGRNEALLELFNNTNISGQALKETRYLANWALFQDAAQEYSSNNKVRDINDLAHSVLDVQHLFSSRSISGEDTGFTKEFRENLRTMSRERASIFQKGFQREEDVIPGHRFGDYMVMKKAISPLDLIKNINDGSKWKAFGKQFGAGRNNMQDVTTATLFPYFSLFRLTDAVSSIGLGFSPKSTGSVLDLASNIMFKRVLPIAGAFAALSYLDYESENLTGTSLRGAAANSWANMDLTNRRISDAIGLTGFLKTQYELNPMTRYWSDQPYQSYEERKAWYENGTSPVRKSRWWSFGSTSEFRGSKIDYFEPNFLRQAHSNWQDIGVYGSSDEKWAHSWIPTPRHPLAPLKALADPYWLERKHYWDRPYPVSGKLFEEGTPWGAILNPTVGQIIKPVKRMHREELGNTLVDVRSLIAQRNYDIQAKANKYSSLVRIDGTGEFTPVSYTPLGAPTESERILNMNLSGGRVSGAYVPGMDYQAMALADYEPIHDALQARAEMIASGGNTPVEVNPNLSAADRIQVSADRGGVVSGVVAKMIPLEMISAVNNQIKARANIAPGGGKNGVIIPDAIFSTAKSTTGLLGDAQFTTDLLNVSTTKDFLKDAAYSMKELTGIYGFIYDEIFPSRRSARMQSADRMNSFSRRFWDSSVGGLGGEFMEIARRFIPHEDHSIDRINPIKNTMPDWMPARFQYGDPYEQLPKGEMRLPGAAYEDINNLHSDMYGRYGAFDRMKILADIAPWSREYRIWREIASKTVKDPYLQDQMEKIKDNVQRQSKQHDFYPYRFIGAKLSSQSAVIDSVDEHTFTVVGSNTKYKLAGINITEGSLQNYLAPGTPVTLRYGEGDANQKNISAIVMRQGNNLNRELISNKQAEASKDNTAAGVHARFTNAQIDQGKLYELIAHAPIPFIHNKFMRVNSPIESWKDEYIYGTSYATWSHPIQGFIVPAFQKAFSVGHGQAAVGLATWMLSWNMDKSGAKPFVKGAAKAAYLLTNPGAFTGAVMGGVSTLSMKYATKMAHVGAAIGLAGYAYTHSNNPIFTSVAGAALGRQVAEQLWKGTGKQGALIGTIAGLTLTAMKNPNWDPDKMWGPWIPGKVQKRWEIEEYYDRLKYIKYTGLFEKAARLAKAKEGVDIKRILNKMEYDAEKREKIEKELLANRQLISNTYAVGDKRRTALMSEIDSKLEALKYPQQVLEAGEYTKSALAYKQAAESTVYGLDKDATWSQILRAVPKYERDYVLEFGKETDPKRRKEIMKYIAPYRRKVLENLWGEKQSKTESNASFFSNHKLPGLFWGGWQPDVDLDNVQIKTIKNEGMLLSDFGFYDSQAETPEAMNAPSVDYDQGTNAIELRKNLLTSLSGAGLIGVDVSIEPSSQPGIQMIANIARITDYQIKQKLNGFLGRVFY